MSEHAKTFSPSESHRVFKCPGSLRKCKDIPNIPNAAATRGTATHALAQIVLDVNSSQHQALLDYRAEFKRITGFMFNFTDNEEVKQMKVDDAMETNVMQYIDHVRDLAETGVDPIVSIELRADLTHVHPEMWGTCDLAVDDCDLLTITDYKNGRIAVPLLDPEFDHEYPDLEYVNSQVLIYAVGILNKFKWFHKRLQLQIVQPNSLDVQWLQSVVLPVPLVKKWSETKLVQHVKDALDPNAPLHAGDHCRFCLANGDCTELLRFSQAIAVREFGDVDEVDESITKTDKLSDEQILKILRWGPALKQMVKSAYVTAMNRLNEKNENIESHYKIISKSGHRKWPENVTEEQELRDLLVAQARFPIREELTRSKLMSPAQVQAMIGGKKGKTIVDAIAEKPQTYAMVSVNDKRPAITPGCIDFANIEEDED